MPIWQGSTKCCICGKQNLSKVKFAASPVVPILSCHYRQVPVQNLMPILI